MDNLRNHWLHRCWLVGRPQRKTQEFCVVFVSEWRCEEDCGVDGSPGGVDGKPFGMDQPLFTSVGALQRSQGLSLSHPRIRTSQTRDHFLLRKFVGTSRPRIGVLTVTFAFLQHIVRGMYLLLAFLNVGFAENCFSTGPIWVSSGESI